MDYLKGKEFVTDFIGRTLENLKNAEQYAPYEITLFINSLLGLLIIPEQKQYKNLNKIRLDKKILTEFCKNVHCPDKQGEIMEEQALMRHLRNAIAHVNIKFGTDDENQISRICFFDSETCKGCDKGKRINGKNWLFFVDIEVDKFREFVMEFAQKAADYCKSSVNKERIRKQKGGV